MITPDVAIVSNSNRTNRITDPLDTTKLRYSVNPNSTKDFDIIMCDVPNRETLKEIIKSKYRNQLFIFRMRGDIFPGIKNWNNLKIKRYIGRKMLSYVDVCIPISYHHGQKFEEITGVHTWRTIEISKDPNEWPYQSHYTERPKLITLTNCRPLEKINPICEIMNTVNLALEETNGEWYICGKGKNEDLIIEETQKYDNITFMGYRNPKTMLKWANIMIHPSNFDALPNAILEGMASNLPVITNEHEDFVKRDWDIDIYSNKNELIRYLKRYSYADEREFAGRKNYNYFKNHFTHEIIGKQWVSVLNTFYLTWCL